jgi:hypothetical protein
MCMCALRRQIKISELQAALTAAETAHSGAQDSLLQMTVERDDLKEAVSTLRRRIRDLESNSGRVTTAVRAARLIVGERVSQHRQRCCLQLAVALRGCRQSDADVVASVSGSRSSTTSPLRTRS